MGLRLNSLHLLGLLVVPIGTAQACDRCCNALFQVDGSSPVESQQPEWMQSGAKIHPVEGVRADGVLIHARKDPEARKRVYLTKSFFAQLALEMPEGLHDAPLATYSYSLRADARGSGRDHLFALQSPQVEDQVLSVKGSGTNSFFPPLSPNLSSFRHNGLLELPVGLQEYALSQILMEKRVPVEAYEALTLLPLPLQYVYQKSGALSDVAVQITRRLEQGRASQFTAVKDIPLRQRLRMAAALYLWNLGHGSLNPENVTKNGELLDLGHTSFGYPIYSSAYRCYVCSVSRGDSMDRTLLGPLDFYNAEADLNPEEEQLVFPTQRSHYQNRYRLSLLRSYSGRLKQEEVGIFLSELFGQIFGKKVHLETVSEAVQKGLMHALQERFLIVGPGDPPLLEHGLEEWLNDGRQTCVGRSNKKSYSRKFIVLQTMRAANQILGLKKESLPEFFEPFRFSYSLRFLLQLAALRSLGMPEIEWNGLLGRVSDQVLNTKFYPYAAFVSPLVRFFVEVFAQNSLTTVQALRLLEHPLPTDAMNERIASRLRQLQWSEHLGVDLGSLLDELTEVQKPNAERFVQQVREWLDTMDEVANPTSVIKF